MQRSSNIFNNAKIIRFFLFSRKFSTTYLLSSTYFRKNLMPSKMVSLSHIADNFCHFSKKNLRKSHFSRLSPNFCNYHLCPQGNFRDNAKTKIISALLQGQKGVAKCVKRMSRNVSEGCRRMFIYLKKVSSFMTKGETLGRLWPGRSNMCRTTTSVPAFHREKQTWLLKGQ